MKILDEMRELAPWHFDIEVAPGIRTSQGNADRYADSDKSSVSVVNPDEMRALFESVGIAGKSFLDVACNGGGYSLLAHRMGATRVFGFDTREHWIRQATFLRERLNAPSVEFRVMPLAELGDTRYDITLFKGIFYHLPDPIHDLRKLCSITNETIIIDTATSANCPEHCLEPMMESVTHVMSGVDGLAWKPGGPEAINRIVSWLGFTHTKTIYWHRETAPGWGRMRVIASRKPITGLHS